MKKSHLIELFNSFSRKEQRELGKFVNSPVFNQRDDVKLLYQFLYKNHPFKRDSVLEKVAVYQALYPKKKYDEKDLDYIMSFLYSVMKAQLVHQEMTEHPYDEELYLNRALRKRKITRLFEKELNTCTKKFKKKPHRNVDYHYFNYRLNVEKYEYNQSVSRVESDSFQELSDEFTNYFIANKLWQSCTAISHKKVSQTDFKQDLLTEVIAHVERNDYSNVPAVNIYYHCYKSLTSEDAALYFGKLTKLIEENVEKFPQAELRDIYVLAINYCIGQFNKGKSEFIRTAFELYKNGLQQKVFIENGYLSRFTYHNIALSGMVLKEFDWVYDFIVNYKDLIEKKYRESTFHYNLAIYYFRKPDHDQAMDLLQKVEFNDVHWNLNARRMLLKIYFEKEEFESLNSLLTSLKNFIYRHKKIGGYHRDNNLNLIKFVSRLLSLKKYDKEARVALREEIEATKGVADKAWLLEQF